MRALPWVVLLAHCAVPVFSSSVDFCDWSPAFLASLAASRQWPQASQAMLSSVIGLGNEAHDAPGLTQFADCWVQQLAILLRNPSFQFPKEDTVDWLGAAPAVARAAAVSSHNTTDGLLELAVRHGHHDALVNHPTHLWVQF